MPTLVAYMYIRTSTYVYKVLLPIYVFMYVWCISFVQYLGFKEGVWHVVQAVSRIFTYAHIAHVHRVEVINFRQNVHGVEARRPRGSRGRHAAQPGN